MACGDIDWWRSPDIQGLLERHGQIEHLIIQVDFLMQLQRDPRAEFSIQGASKSRVPGRTGYADIVSKATQRIWEIKPAHLEAKAVLEAAHYVRHAQLQCGPGWAAGQDYRVSDWAKSRYTTENIVYRIEAEGLRYELESKQGAAGAVVYSWIVNGKNQGALDNAWGWAVRAKVVADYFGRMVPAPLPGAVPPRVIPPVRFTPPVLVPDACIPALQPGLDALKKAIATTCATRVMEGSGVALLLEAAAVDALVGAANVSRTIASLQVKTDPQVELARVLQLALGASGALYGVPFAVYGAWWVGRGVIAALGRVGESAVAAAGVPTLGAELSGLLGTSLQALTTRVAVTAGATAVVVAIPRTSQASGGKPVAVDAFPVKLVPLTPRQMEIARVGQPFSFGGADHYVVGLATPAPAG